MSKPKTRREPVERRSADLLAEQVEKLREIFPEVIAEGKIDFEKFRETLGDEIDDRPERYSFSWAGKRDAIRLLQVPSHGTLTPAPKESMAFEETGDIFIEGENLEVLKLLYKSYFGRVKMIYIDPPYNTGNDFIYSDDYTDPLEAYLKLTGQKDTAGNLLSSNPETSGRYHSAWLSMIYPRLFIARQLLRDDGVIFVSIDDHEVYNFRMLMNEIFGEENFVATVIWQKVYSPKNTARHFSESHDYVVIYARSAESWRPDLLPRTDEANARYENPDNDPRGPWKSGDVSARNYYSEGQYEVASPRGKKFWPPKGRYWTVKHKVFLELDKDKRIWWGTEGQNMPALKQFLSEVKQGMTPQTLWTYKEVGHTQEAKKELMEFVHFDDTDNVLDSVKPTRLIQRMLQLATSTATADHDLVLDFFAGSAATAHAVLKQNREDGGNRRFVMVQLPEPLPAPEKKLKTIADIGKERLRHVIEAMKKGQGKLRDPDSKEDLGFKIFKLARSNYKPWDASEEKDADRYAKQMELHIEPLVRGWRLEDVIWEVAIKEGFSLASRVEKEANGKNGMIYLVTDPEKAQSFRICLDDKIKLASIKSLDLKKDDLFICRDAALDDEAAANLALQCRLKTI
jgi:adenine-specific DNA-methyltransferase